jgi:copper chaperone CopZ
MKIIIILFSTLLFTFTTYATNCNKEGAHSHDEITTNGLSSGQITDNIININVNGMVCDFCAQSIEKVFMKRIEVKGINVNLEDQKVVIYLEKETDIEDDIISTIFQDAGYNVETIDRNS